MAPDQVRVALFAASPIHFRVPIYRLLARHPDIDFTAIFASTGGLRPVDAGYSQRVVWDHDLTRGFKTVFLRRHETNPIEGREPPPSFFEYHDWDVARVIREGRYDVLWLWGYNYLTHQLAALTQVSLGRSVIFAEDQTLLHPRPLWKSLVKSVWLRLLFSRGCAVYVGAENYKWFRRYGIPEHRLFFTPYAVDNARLRASARELRPRKEEIQRSLGINVNDGPVILFVGRLMAKKQPEMLLEAFRRIRRTRACTLLLVGTGPLEEELKRFVAKEAVPGVVFAGFLDQRKLPLAYASADIFVLPSAKHETWGVVVNEAMNFGLPVVVSDKVGCARDLVRHGVNGFVVPHCNVEELEGYLSRLVNSAQLRESLGRAAVERVAEYSYERVVEGLMSAVSSVAWNRRGSQGIDPDRTMTLAAKESCIEKSEAPHA